MSRIFVTALFVIVTVLPISACTATSVESFSVPPVPPGLSGSEASNEEEYREQVGSSSVTLPPCEELVSVSEIRPFHASLELIDREFEGLFDRQFGPVARTSEKEAVQIYQCVWAIPDSEFMYAVLVVELPEMTLNHFVEALRASDYTESALNGMPVFTYDTQVSLDPGEGRGPVSPEIIWHGFANTVWVAAKLYNFDDNIGELVLRSVVEANGPDFV